MSTRIIQATVRPWLLRPAAVRSFSAAQSLHVKTAKVIPAAPDKVWGEIRDFVGHMKHFGLQDTTTHANPEQAASDAKGCIRHMRSSGGTVIETCTGHSDEDLTLSFSAAEPNFLGLTDYHCEISVVPLTDGTSLARCSSSFNGPESLPGAITDMYNKFFASISSELSEGGRVVVERVGSAPALGTGRVAGKVAVVTGGASGIGEAVCKTLASEGATVVVVDNNAEGARKVAADIPGGCFAVVDVTKSKRVAMLLEEVVPEVVGQVDVVVNNAGITGVQVPLHEHPIENWHAVSNVNLNGSFYVLRSSLALMVKQAKGGVIVNMASIVGLTGMGAAIPAYAAAKAALINLTEATAVDYAKHGIRVVAVAPSTTRTPLVEKFMEEAKPEVKQAMLSLNPMPGMPEPKDVAQAVLFLSSDEASWVSGSVIKTDGAYIAGNVFPYGRGSKL